MLSGFIKFHKNVVYTLHVHKCSREIPLVPINIIYSCSPVNYPSLKHCYSTAPYNVLLNHHLSVSIDIIDVRLRMSIISMVSVLNTSNLVTESKLKFLWQKW